MFSEVDQRHMQHALRLAMRGQGFVEPNPLVGCVIAIDQRVVSDGWHQQFGGPHAEVDALRAVMGQDLSRATMYGGTQSLKRSLHFLPYLLIELGSGRGCRCQDLRE